MTQTILYPLSTEKALRMMETDNALVFRIDANATKQEVKDAIEKQFKAKVDAVRTVITSKGKRAYVRFSKETPAIDIATNLGLM